MPYTKQEEIELNKQLKRWQEKQLKAVRKNKWEQAINRMTEIDRRIWEIVANAETHKDVNYLVWDNAQRVIDKYYKMAC
ncbi:MAG: hypothetical protein PHR62_02460 [Paludibacter sp.]|nr:hypothetical protein [Paludibacter sp.]